MQIRVLDMETFDHTLDIPDHTTIASLREMIRCNFNYDVSQCAFYHKGSELPSTLLITPEAFPEGSVIVLFNSRLFPEKSYPTVDGAFHFFSSRFPTYSIHPTPPEDVEDRSVSERWQAIWQSIGAAEAAELRARIRPEDFGAGSLDERDFLHPFDETEVYDVDGEDEAGFPEELFRETGGPLGMAERPEDAGRTYRTIREMIAYMRVNRND
jgi:hypothetical protein